MTTRQYTNNTNSLVPYSDDSDDTAIFFHINSIKNNKLVPQSNKKTSSSSSSTSSSSSSSSSSDSNSKSESCPTTTPSNKIFVDNDRGDSNNENIPSQEQINNELHIRIRRWLTKMFIAIFGQNVMQNAELLK